MPTSETNSGKPKTNGFVTGEWTVSPSRNLLVRGHEQVRVEPRVMDVLVHLVAREGDVVSKEELAERVWEGRFVSDDVLTVTIYALRKALGDDARQPRYVETIPRRGYRWIGPAQSEVVATESATARPEASRSRQVAWRAVAATVVLALFAAVAVSMLTFSRRSRHVPSAESHEAYIKGRFFLDQRSVKGWQQALAQFERAVAVDPQVLRRACRAGGHVFIDVGLRCGLARRDATASDEGVGARPGVGPAVSGRARGVGPRTVFVRLGFHRCRAQPDESPRAGRGLHARLPDRWPG